MAGEITIAGNLVRVEFENHIMPEFVKKNGKDYVYFGNQNNYPEYLIELYNRHAEHGAIVKSKARYIYGKGLMLSSDANPAVKASAETFLSKANRYETWNKVFKKMTRPYEIFNGLVLQIIWSRGGQSFEAYYMEFSKFRKSACGKKVMYCEKWIKEDGSVNNQAHEDPTYKVYDNFNPAIRTGTQILYYREDTPYTQKYGDLYPMPEYSGAIADIETDIEISNFHYSNLKNGFTASAMLSLFNGEPTEGDKKKIAQMLKANHTGSNNAGKILLNFATKESKGAEVVSFTASDLDKQFELLSKRIQQKVISAHSITNPILAGIKTEGQLGGRTELIEAYELFYNTYVVPRQNALVTIIKDLGYIAGVDLSELQVDRLDPVSVDITDPSIAKYFTEDEIREKLGYKPKNAIINADGTVQPVQAETAINEHLKNLTGKQWINIKRLIREVGAGKTSKEVATMMLKNSYGLNDEDILILLKPNAQFSAQGIDHVLSLFESCAIDENPHDEFISEDFVNFKSSGEALNFEFSKIKQKFDDDLVSNEVKNSILDLLKGSPKTPTETIAKQLGIDALQVTETINTLSTEGLVEGIAGALKVTDKGINTPTTPVLKTEIYTVYKYVTRDDVPRATTSRPFCKKMLSLSSGGKVWTREALDKLTNDIGEEVWSYRGGFYTNPNTNETEPFCRHIFKAITRSRTKKG